ncbi:MAG: hypothetical protein CMF80_07795 [Candidatus Marinimicrobia bacterium]|nr:hypothetical protein [Candidatus Neomarinimicrobiota bacterium]|tara:strand:+ start:650 stop:1036 length:387 start_codon:yes stop_codon:yes gene_type:complete
MNKILSTSSLIDISNSNCSSAELLNNSFYNDLGEIMEDPKYTNFFDKYFSTTLDIQSTLFYMKLYRELQIKYKDRKGIDLDKMTNIAVINYIMNLPDLRRSVMKAIVDNYSDDSKIKKVISETNLLTN